MNVHQIFITDSGGSELPPYLRMAVDTVRSKIPNIHHKIYFNDDIRDIIRSCFGGNMLKAYDKLIPYAYKADLARYLLLYQYGGWYFDISIRVINGVSVGEDVDFVTFVDFPQYTGVSYGCNNAIIYSKPKSLILEDVINNVYKNISIEYYGNNTLCITGPVVLGRSVSKNDMNLNVVTGSFVDLTPGFVNRNRGFIFNDGLLFALHKDGNQGGDLEKLGVINGNNYVQLYQKKNVFDKSVTLLPCKFPGDFVGKSPE